MKKIAIITGATGGIGQAFVDTILEEDIDEIWAVARNETKLTKLKINYGDKIRMLKCDLGSSKDIQGIGELLKKEKPNVRILVNNAGVAKMGKYSDFSSVDISDTIDVNCKAICLLCHYVIPYMKHGSRILNISSASSFQPNPYINLYSASKVFVRSYSRSLNYELKGTGIVCTAVCPGWVDTEMLAREQDGNKIKFPGIVSAERVARQAMKDSAKGRDMSVCSLFVKYEHFISKILPQKWIMDIWVKGIRDYV